MIFLKAAFFEVQDWEEQHLREGLKDFDLRLFKDPLEERNVKEAADSEVVSVFIYSNLDRPLIDKLSKVRLVATRSTGFDHIDLKAAQ